MEEQIRSNGAVQILLADIHFRNCLQSVICGHTKKEGWYVHNSSFLIMQKSKRESYGCYSCIIRGGNPFRRIPYQSGISWAKETGLFLQTYIHITYYRRDHFVLFYK